MGILPEIVDPEGGRETEEEEEGHEEVGLLCTALSVDEALDCAQVVVAAKANAQDSEDDTDSNMTQVGLGKAVRADGQIPPDELHVSEEKSYESEFAASSSEMYVRLSDADKDGTIESASFHSTSSKANEDMSDTIKEAASANSIRIDGDLSPDRSPVRLSVDEHQQSKGKIDSGHKTAKRRSSAAFSWLRSASSSLSNMTISSSATSDDVLNRLRKENQVAADEEALRRLEDSGLCKQLEILRLKYIGDGSVDWELWDILTSGKVADPLRIRTALTIGLPEYLRGIAWQSILQSKTPELETLFSKVLVDAPAHPNIDRIIRKDITRTFPKLDQFRSNGSTGLSRQESLFKVCKAYGNYDPEVGYMQGMAFIAGPLLLHMEEAEAFCVFVQLMKRYRLREFFIPNTPGLLLLLYQFDRLVEDHAAKVAIHFKRLEIKSHMYASQWFLTCFAYCFPMQIVVRIYDFLVFDGPKAFLNFSLALIIRNKAKILAINDFNVLLKFLKEHILDGYRRDKSKGHTPSTVLGRTSQQATISIEELIADSGSIIISDAMIEDNAREFACEIEKEQRREAEIVILRNEATLAANRAKELENQLAQVNREHVELANELITTRMVVAELTQKNQSLTDQLADLQDLTERQPAEVEQRLREEMDRLLTRNEEVMTLNRELEEQFTSVESQLVDTKMKLAAAYYQNETSTQKWHRIQKAVMED